MKKCLLLLSLIVSTNTFSQRIKNAVKISKAKRVNIKDSKVNITKADSVYITYVTEPTKTKIYLKIQQVKKDSSGLWVSRFIFGPKEIVDQFFVNITMRFDKPFLRPQDVPFPIFANISGSGTSEFSAGYNDELTEVHISGRAMSSENSIWVELKSKDIIRPITISGVEGQLF